VTGLPYCQTTPEDIAKGTLSCTMKTIQVAQDGSCTIRSMLRFTRGCRSQFPNGVILKITSAGACPGAAGSAGLVPALRTPVQEPGYLGATLPAFTIVTGKQLETKDSGRIAIVSPTKRAKAYATVRDVSFLTPLALWRRPTRALSRKTTVWAISSGVYGDDPKDS